MKRSAGQGNSLNTKKMWLAVSKGERRVTFVVTKREKTLVRAAAACQCRVRECVGPLSAFLTRTLVRLAESASLHA